MSFYVTLPSNSSMEFYPDNVITNFTTQLKIPIKFDVPYEVALVEISFNQSWKKKLGYLNFSFNGSQYKFIVEPGDGELFEATIERLNKKLQDTMIPLYIVHLSRAKPNINVAIETEKFKQSQDFPKIIYKDKLLRFECNPTSFFKFEGYVASFLNVIDQELDTNTKPIPIENITLTGTQAIYVYTDIVDFQFVGDSFAPLLRTVVTQEDKASVSCVRYDNPHYVPVKINSDLFNVTIFQNEIIASDMNEQFEYHLGHKNGLVSHNQDKNLTTKPQDFKILDYQNQKVVDSGKEKKICKYRKKWSEEEDILILIGFFCYQNSWQNIELYVIKERSAKMIKE